MGRYAHPALAEREEIMLMRHEGRSPADIARATGRDRSTISREMRRNSFRVGAGPLLPGIDRATLLRGAGSPACVPGSSTTRGSPGSSRG